MLQCVGKIKFFIVTSPCHSVGNLRILLHTGHSSAGKPKEISSVLMIFNAFGRAKENPSEGIRFRIVGTLPRLIQGSKVADHFLFAFLKLPETAFPGNQKTG